jgi:hypothetical protein
MLPGVGPLMNSERRDVGAHGADHVPLRSMPPGAAARPGQQAALRADQAVRNLDVLASWNDGTAGGDPYNNSRVRPRA